MSESSKPVISRVLDMYADLFKRRPTVLIVLTLYMAAGMAIFGYRYFKLSDASQNGKERVAELTRELETQRRIVASLTSGSRDGLVLRDIEFKEDWPEDTRVKATRILDYVSYAYNKNDFDYAKRQLAEAPELQGSLTAGYWLARIAFATHDFEGAKAELGKIIQKDKDNRYPAVRFYAAIVSHELGKQDEVMSLLKAYLASTQGSTNR